MIRLARMPEYLGGCRKRPLPAKRIEQGSRPEGQPAAGPLIKSLAREEDLLTRMIDERNVLLGQLNAAQLRMDEFIAAAQIRAFQSAGGKVDLKTFPQGVLDFLGKLADRSAKCTSPPAKLSAKDVPAPEQLAKYAHCAICGLTINSASTYCAIHGRQARDKVQRAD